MLLYSEKGQVDAAKKGGAGGVRCQKGASKANTGKPLQDKTSGDFSNSEFRGTASVTADPVNLGLLPRLDEKRREKYICGLEMQESPPLRVAE